MPAAEVEIDVAQVRRLLGEQNPELAGRPIVEFGFGWDNVSFRLGADLVARFPRRELAADLIANEARWLPHLAPRLPLEIPMPVFLGDPGHGYPWHWLITSLIPGESASTATEIDNQMCAQQLGEFLAALHTPAPQEAPKNPFRGGPLSGRDHATRSRLESLADEVDSTGLELIWEQALAAPEHSGDPVWLHGDLHPDNLLIGKRRLSGVVDFGDITAGDPATDLAIVWSFLDPDHRTTFWHAYGEVGDALRMRARGWVVSLGTAYVANSADNPIMAQIGERSLAAVLDDG